MDRHRKKLRISIHLIEESEIIRQIYGLSKGIRKMATFTKYPGTGLAIKISKNVRQTHDHRFYLGIYR